MTHLSFRRILYSATLAAGLVAVAAHASQPLDTWVTARVKAQLQPVGGASTLPSVDVDTVEGLTTLHGVVAADAERTRAARVARQVAGVRRVRNLLVVLPAARRKAVETRDRRLARQLRDALEREPGLEGSAVRVASVHDGVALLAGRAASLLAHRRAIQTASDLPGLRRVASEIRSPDRAGDRELWEDTRPDGLLPPRLADLWLTLRAHWELLTRMGLTPLDVDVDTRDGVVTLSGVVASLEEKVGAEMELLGLEGVREVQSLLRLAPVAQAAAPLPDGTVHARVTARLASERALRGADIRVEMDRGVVRLHGSVPGARSRVRAVEVARDAGGGRAVLNELRVGPPPRS